METPSYQKAKDKMAIRRPHISIITLNVKWTELTNKKAQNCRMDQKTKHNQCCLRETLLNSKDIYRFKVKGWKMIFQANGIQRKSRVAILISDKVDFKIKKVKKDTESYFIMKKGIMHQEDITFINIYAPNQGPLKYVKQLLIELKGETDENINIVGGLNTPLSDIDRSPKQKINKEITSLNDTLDQLDIIYIYRAFPPPNSCLYIFL
uniref:Uncharacterized protein n=1 Tax=Rousettus aegyptiacus TaxID=9407 RepID=A0A7J8C2I9_ROUAE|nr:hypothetical protein HJG63_009360 [Rousettus aegyptiacus]